MNLLNEIRFLSAATIVFMLISLFAVSYLFFYSNTPNHLGNTGELTDSLVAEVPLTANATKGQVLFKQNCAKCHYTTGQKSVGPGLLGIMDRITEDQLISWVQSPAETIKKDRYFEKLAEEYYPERMPSFTLSKEEILLIMEYVNASANQRKVMVLK